jgi:hypothetical protein
MPKNPIRRIAAINDLEDHGGGPVLPPYRRRRRS